MIPTGFPIFNKSSIREQSKYDEQIYRKGFSLPSFYEWARKRMYYPSIIIITYKSDYIYID